MARNTYPCQGGDPGTGGRPSPPRRDRECHSRPQVRRGVEPSPLGPLPRQRRLAGRPGDRPQPGTLDGAHRSGPAGGDHQDPLTTLLLPCRTAHPLGAPPHFASAPALALGNPVQSRPGTAARSAISCLTARLAPDPSTGLPDRLADLRQAGPRTSLAARYPDNFARHGHRGPPSS